MHRLSELLDAARLMESPTKLAQSLGDSSHGGYVQLLEIQLPDDCLPELGGRAEFDSKSVCKKDISRETCI